MLAGLGSDVSRRSSSTYLTAQEVAGFLLIRVEVGVFLLCGRGVCGRGGVVCHADDFSKEVSDRGGKGTVGVQQGFRDSRIVDAL